MHLCSSRIRLRPTLFLPFPSPFALDACNPGNPYRIWTTATVTLLQACFSDMAKCPHRVLPCAEQYYGEFDNLLT